MTDLPSPHEIARMQREADEAARRYPPHEVERIMRVAKAAGGESFGDLVECLREVNTSAESSAFKVFVDHVNAVGDSSAVRSIVDDRNRTAANSGLRSAFEELSRSGSSDQRGVLASWATLRHASEAINTVGEDAIEQFGADLEAQSAKAKRFVEQTSADLEKTTGVSREVARRLVQATIFCVTSALLVYLSIAAPDVFAEVSKYMTIAGTGTGQIAGLADQLLFGRRSDDDE